MTTFTADPNTWYTISRQFPPLSTAQNVSLRPYDASDPSAPVFLAPGSNLTNFSWQFYPITSPPNGTYLLRPCLDGLSAFFTAIPNTGNLTDCTILGWDCTITAALRPRASLASVWTFSSVLDGTRSFYLSNASNGSTYHLDIWPNGSWLRMSDNITSQHWSQQFQVVPVGTIDDVAWQSVNAGVLEWDGAAGSVPNVTNVDTSTAPTTNSTTPSSVASTATTTATGTPSSHTGLAAGVGAGVGVAILCVLAVLLWFFLRWRKAKRQASYQQADSGHSSPFAMVDISTTEAKRPEDELHEVEGDEAGHELLAERERAEAPGDERPRYELPG